MTSDEADRLARERAATTGDSLTEAVEVSLPERLTRQRAASGQNPADRRRKLQREAALLPAPDDRPDEDAEVEIVPLDKGATPRV
ncbi:type II toxin-antitoxin system VapB family antitoxin [Actinomycetes bacterium KLBMP 9759]